MRWKLSWSVDVLANDKQRDELEKLYQELEWRRCAEDPYYFLSRYVYIESERDSRGKELFKLWDYQEEALDTFIRDRFCVVLKSRQLGFTTLAMAYALWLCLFKPRANVLLLSKSQDSADKNLGMARYAYSFLPEWMKARGPKLDGDAAKQIVFLAPDGSSNRIKSFAGTKTAGAGETASLVILDEFALMEDPGNTYRTIKPTTDAGGKLIIISTARGSNNQFARIYRDAKRGMNGFTPLFQPWSASRLITQDDYDAKKREFIAEPWLFYAEYPSSDEEAFRESGRPRFQALPSPEDAEEFTVHGWVDETDNGFVFRQAEDDESWLASVHLVCHPLDIPMNRKFVVSADPALGVGNDFSAAHILAWMPDGDIEIVGYMHSNTVEPGDWAEDLYRVGRFFAGFEQSAALLVVESTGGGAGITIIDKLRNHMNYPNLYRWLPPVAARKRRAPVFGFPTSRTTKPLIIDRLAEFVNKDESGECRLINIYPLLRDELGTFVRRENGSTAADVGCHDDLVMSLAIGVYALSEDATTVGVGPIGERSTPSTVTLSVASIFEEADKIRSIEGKRNSRMWRETKRVSDRRMRLR
jgi:hypothetical protein